MPRLWIHHCTCYLTGNTFQSYSKRRKNNLISHSKNQTLQHALKDLRFVLPIKKKKLKRQKQMLQSKDFISKDQYPSTDEIKTHISLFSLDFKPLHTV